MNRSRRILIVFAVAVVAFVSWPYLPLKGLLQSSGETATVAAQTAALQVQIEAANAALADQETFAAALAAAQQAVPDDADLPALIDDVEAVIRRAGMSWDSGASAPTPLASAEQGGIPGVDTWQMSLTVTGPSVQAVSDLIGDLRAMSRLVVVPTLSIQLGEDGVTASLGILYFSLAAAQAPADAAQPAPGTDLEAAGG